MNRRLKKIFRRIELEQGDASERYLDDILRSHRDVGRLPPWILGWERTEKWSQADMAGVDFIIHTDRGDIRLNVKNSHTFAKQFENKHKGDDIIAVVVNRFDPPQRFMSLFVSRIGAIWRSMPKQQRPQR